MNQTQPGKGAPRRLDVPRKRRWIRPLLLIVIFVSGGVAGSALTVIFRPGRARRGRRTVHERRDRITKRIADRLDLSSQQREQVRAIVEERLKELEKLRKEIQPRMERQGDILHREIADLLDDRQRAEWDKYFSELFKRWFPEPVSTRPATKPAGKEEEESGTTKPSD